MTALVVIGAAWLAPVRGEAGTCACVHHSSTATQSGAGLCAVVEDARRCAITTLGIAPGQTAAEILQRLGNRAALDSAVQAAGIPIAAGEALRIAGQQPPETWPRESFPAVLTVLLALPAAGAPAQNAPLAGIYRLLAEHEAALWRRFADAAQPRQAERIDLGSYTAAVAYGCIELAQNDLLVRARVPFAAAGNRCGEP